MSSSLLNYLPPADGLLPKWLLFVSIVSMANSIQAYTSLTPTQTVYPGPAPPPSPPAGIPPRTLVSSSSSSHPASTSPVTPLSARTFGTWTAITAIVRLYAAYHIEIPAMYELAFATFGVAFAHFLSEWLVFGSTRLGRGLLGPVGVSTGTLVWMWVQWGFYVKA